MGRSLSAEEVEEILETYAENHSRSKTADKLGRSEDTVRKYVNQAVEDGDPRMPEVHEDGEGQEAGGDEPSQPSESPFGSETESRIIENYSDMTPGDFIEDFFDAFEIGVKSNWVTIQARRADRRGKIPTKNSLKKDLLSMKSGINKSAIKEAEYIAQEYWAEAQNFLRETGYEADPEPRSGPQQGVGMGGQMGQGAASGFGQEFVGPEGLQMGQMGGMGQQQVVPLLMQEIRELREDVRRSKQQSQRGQEQGSTLDRLKELKQEKEILEEISGGDERLQAIEEQIVQLQQQAMAENAQQQAMPPSGGESFEDRLLDLAARDQDVSLSEVFEIIEERQDSVTDPRVMEKEKELEIEQARLEHEQERQEQLAGTLETVAERIGQGIGEKIASGGGASQSAGDQSGGSEAAADGGDTATTRPQREVAAGQQGQPAQAEAMGAAQPDPDPCPNCGAELRMDGAGMACPECEYGIANCDLCTYPVEIPPRGDARHGRCGKCEALLEAPEDDDAEMECGDCGWTGTADELRGEGLKCEGCGEIRPIQRGPDPDKMQERIEELTGD